MTTKFAFEVPVAHLEDFNEYQDFHFALSTLCRSSKKYLEFYQEQVEQCLKVVYMDNSYNEYFRADDPLTLARTAQKLHPHLIICPDSPKWPTFKIQEAFDRMLDLTTKTALYPPILMVVVRDESMLNHMRRRGATEFAVSHWIPPRTEGRYDDVRWARQCHFLGMNSPQELRELQPPSCDTTLPIKLAMQGKALRKWWEEGCPYLHDKNKKDQRDRKKEYFNLIFDDKTLELAIQNIIALKMLCTET
jgi:hypothetical protein